MNDDARNEETNTLARYDWLAALLLHRPEGFLARFAAGAARWRALPRHYRRRLARRVAATAAGAALILAMTASPLLVPSARAATITVDETTCTLIDAIRSANTDTAVGGCVSGDAGLDTIDLQADVTLMAAAGDYFGDTGLPSVTSEIVIEGNGFTIERDGAAPDFRILFVASTGDLTLNDVTISGGSAGANNGGGFYVVGGKLALINSTVSDNDTIGGGGGGLNERGTVTITDSIFRYNTAEAGGGLYMDFSIGGPVTTQATITNSLFEKNTTNGAGGGLYVDKGELNIVGSTITGNDAGGVGGGLFTFYSEAIVTVTGSTFSDNVARRGGGTHIREGDVTFINSTISGNTANVDNGGGFYNRFGTLTLINATVTDNYAKIGGGGISQSYAHYSTTLSRSIISGNVTGSDEGIEIASADGTITTDDNNVFSHSVLTSAIAFYNFTPGASDFDASSNASNVALAAILDTTLADNGGPTLTHNLVADSPAVDFAPDADCVADPTGAVDQRGAPRPFDVPGQGNEVTDTCDAGAVEYNSPVPGGTSIFMSTTAPGVTDDAVAFGGEDILRNDGGDWSLWFDGSAAGLTPTGKWKHNINAFWLPDPAGEDVVMSFTQNARIVPGIAPKVDGMDLVWWDGSAFSLWFDGSDVGLTNKTQEKIDGLHVLPGSESPIGGSCLSYLLVSTQGPGRVPSGFGGAQIRFGGEDVLGFCLTNSGSSTTGFWHMVLDGSAEGMPKNSTGDFSLSADGQTLYLTTKGTFNVDAAAGGHSMVYAYDMTSGQFSGPLFIAADEGLPQKVDGLQVEGDLD